MYGGWCPVRPGYEYGREWDGYDTVLGPVGGFPHTLFTGHHTGSRPPRTASPYTGVLYFEARSKLH